uniref:Uncharacterized protein n=1 Tax=Romanomermis culicivorax TaxID=13658 RepID=A0A915HPV9_ROMCU
MKSGLMAHLTDLLGFPVSLIYELEVCTRLDAENDPPQPTHINDVWIEHVAPDQPLRDSTYHNTHYCYLPDTLLSILQADASWLQRITATMLLTAAIASPCSTAPHH